MHKTKSKPVVEQSAAYMAAFDYFNKELFGNELPRPMLLFTRNANIVGGYYSPEKWSNEDGGTVDEIAINANLMVMGDEVDIFQVLVHEMSHQWQHHFGKPSRNGYHNREWADKAISIGLHPFSAKNPEVQTGESIGTRLIDGGKAMLAIAELPESVSIPWYAASMEDKMGNGNGGNGENKNGKAPDNEEPPMRGTRAKFTCVVCGLNAWAKPTAKLVCGECQKELVMTK